MSTRQRGFTLIEAIVVIVLTGIIAGAVAVFLRWPVQSYVDTAARAELSDTADLALRRMSRDLRLALPNSVRVTNNGNIVYLELLLTKTGGRYLDPEDGVSGNVLVFEKPGVNCGAVPSDCKFDVVGNPPGASALTADQALVPNSDYVVVYNLGPGFGDADAYGTGNRALVTGFAGSTITLQSNPFALQAIPMRSPSHRFQVVSTPVTYVCDGSAGGGAGLLKRYWGYAIQATQPKSTAAAPLSTTASSALLANGVVSCVFDYQNLVNLHSALVGLTLSLQAPASKSGTVTLRHQIHVDNTP